MLKDDLIPYSYLEFLTKLKSEDIEYILNGKHVINKKFDDIINLILNENYMLDYFFENRNIILSKLNKCIKDKEDLFFGRLDYIYEITYLSKANDFLYIFEKMTTKELEYFIELSFLTFDTFIENFKYIRNSLKDEFVFLSDLEYKKIFVKEFWYLINN